MPRAAVTRAPFDVAVEEVARAEGPAAGEVLLTVDAVGLCGTDLHIVDGSFPVAYPLIQGHEVSALVAALPEGYDGPLAVGERVAVEPVTSCGRCYACRRGAPNACVALSAIGVQRPGGLQEQLLVPASACYPVGGLPAVTAALCEPLSIALHAVGRAEVQAGEQVLVLGAGPIGLAALIAAVDRGAEVMTVDLHEARLELAAELGAAVTVRGTDDVAAAAQRWTGGDGPGVVIEATGVPRVAATAFDLVAPSGRIALIGVSEEQLSVSLRLFTLKELTVVGSRSCARFGDAVALASRAAPKLARLVTHEFALEDAPEAFRQAREHPDATVKVVVRI